MARHCPLTLDEALERWLAVKLAGRGLSVKTVKAYRADIATSAAYFAGVSPCDRTAATRVRVGALTPEAVTAALSAVWQAGAADKTRARLHGTVTSLLAYLVEQDHLDSDPLADAGLQRPRSARGCPATSTTRASSRRSSKRPQNPIPPRVTPGPNANWRWPRYSAGTSARAGEICALTVRDLVLEGDEPYVRVLGKGNVARDCPLTAELVQIIKRYLASREQRTGRPPRGKEPVFLNTRLDPLTPAALDHSIRRWFTRAGVPMPAGAAAHAFRHTAAMQLIEQGESATVVQDLLGHASLSSIQIYTKAAGRHVRAAAHQLPVRHLIAGLSGTAKST
jgi:integrase/recombinase XerD